MPGLSRKRKAALEREYLKRRRKGRATDLDQESSSDSDYTKRTHSYRERVLIQETTQAVPTYTVVWRIVLLTRRTSVRRSHFYSRRLRRQATFASSYRNSIVNSTPSKCTGDLPSRVSPLIVALDISGLCGLTCHIKRISRQMRRDFPSSKSSGSRMPQCVSAGDYPPIFPSNLALCRCLPKRAHRKNGRLCSEEVHISPTDRSKDHDGS